jgi:hypothetical protein
MEPESSLLDSQETSTGSYPKPVQSSPYDIILSKILIISSNLRLGLPSGLFLSGFPTKTLYSLLFYPYVLHALPIASSFSLFILMIFGEEYKS